MTQISLVRYYDTLAKMSDIRLIEKDPPSGTQAIQPIPGIAELDTLELQLLCLADLREWAYLGLHAKPPLPLLREHHSHVPGGDRAAVGHLGSGPLAAAPFGGLCAMSPEVPPGAAALITRPIDFVSGWEGGFFQQLIGFAKRADLLVLKLVD